MAKDIRQQFGRILDSAKSGLSSVHTAMQQPNTSAAYFYPSTLDLLSCCKAGWLRRQTSQVLARSSWQRCWCIIKGDYMYLYSTQDESKQPIAAIFLPCSNIIEHTYESGILASGETNERFRFEIVLSTDSSSDTLRSGRSHTFAAENEEDKKDWIKVIYRVLYSTVGGAIFGQSLDATLHFEMSRTPNRKVPEIVQSCVEYLTRFGLLEEGLFRLPGRAGRIRQLCIEFDRGERPSLDCDDNDVHTIASLLKQYLRDLPGPLIPFEFYERVIRVVTREMPVAEAASIDKLGQLLRDIPFANYNTLQYLCRFLQQIASHADVNKMTTANLATVFVQSFITPEIDDPALQMGTVSARTSACLTMIVYADRIFSSEFTAHGDQLLVADLLGLDGNDDDGDAEIRERGARFGTAFDRCANINSDLVGLELGLNGDGPKEWSENGVDPLLQSVTNTTVGPSNSRIALSKARSVDERKLVGEDEKDESTSLGPPVLRPRKKSSGVSKSVVMRTKPSFHLSMPAYESSITVTNNRNARIISADMIESENANPPSLTNFQSTVSAREDDCKSSKPPSNVFPTIDEQGSVCQSNCVPRVKPMVRSRSSVTSGAALKSSSTNPVIPPKPIITRHSLSQENLIMKGSLGNSTPVSDFACKFDALSDRNIDALDLKDPDLRRSRQPQGVILPRKKSDGEILEESDEHHASVVGDDMSVSDVTCLDNAETAVGDTKRSSSRGSLTSEVASGSVADPNEDLTLTGGAEIELRADGSPDVEKMSRSELIGHIEFLHSQLAAKQATIDRLQQELQHALQSSTY